MFNKPDKMHVGLTRKCCAVMSCDMFMLCFPALNKTMERLEFRGESLEDYNYKNKQIADIILEEIAGLQFTGMSVREQLHKEKHDQSSLTFFSKKCV